MKRRWWLSGLVLTGALAASGLAYVRNTSAAVEVHGGAIVDRVVARGIVDAKDGIAEVRSLVDGRVLSVLVRAGDEVQKGQLLAELESDTVTAELAQKEAEKRALAANAGSVRDGARPEERAALEAEARAARHEWELAKRRAEQDQRLFENGGLAASTQDDSAKIEKVKRAQLEQTESRLDLAKAGGRHADVAAARERVTAAEAAAELTRRHLERTKIFAPLHGRILVRHVDKGDTVVAAVAAPLFELADVSRTEVRIEVEEIDASRVTTNLGIKATLPGGAVARGKITRVSPRLERRTIDADDARVRAEAMVRLAWLDWEQPSEIRMLPLGQHLDVTIELPPREAALLVPRGAIEIRDGQAIVRVPFGPWASEKKVELGAADERYVEVRGLSAGQRVLVPAL